MYEKIVNYFESNLCIANVYFREKNVLWMSVVIVTFLVEFIINYVISSFIDNMCTKIVIILLIDFLIAFIFFILAYILPVNKIYKAKIKEKTELDWVGILILSILFILHLFFKNSSISLISISLYALNLSSFINIPTQSSLVVFFSVLLSAFQ